MSLPPRHILHKSLYHILSPIRGEVSARHHQTMDRQPTSQLCQTAAARYSHLPTASTYLINISTNPLTHAEITALQKRHGDDIAECLICYRKYFDETETGDPLKVHDASTNTGSVPHIFCRDLITQHFEEYDRCPACQAVLFRMEREDDIGELLSELDRGIASANAAVAVMIQQTADLSGNVRETHERRRELEEKEREEFERAVREK